MHSPQWQTRLRCCVRGAGRGDPAVCGQASGQPARGTCQPCRVFPARHPFSALHAGKLDGQGCRTRSHRRACSRRPAAAKQMQPAGVVVAEAVMASKGAYSPGRLSGGSKHGDNQARPVGPTKTRCPEEGQCPDRARRIGHRSGGPGRGIGRAGDGRTAKGANPRKGRFRPPAPASRAANPGAALSSPGGGTKLLLAGPGISFAGADGPFVVTFNAARCCRSSSESHPGRVRGVVAFHPPPCSSRSSVPTRNPPPNANEPKLDKAGPLTLVLVPRCRRGDTDNSALRPSVPPTQLFKDNPASPVAAVAAAAAAAD